jgi:Mg-chelatase subunit ChlD
VRQTALALAKTLLLRAATQLAGAGVRRASLELRRGAHSDDIDLDATVENIAADPLAEVEETLVTWDRATEEAGFVLMFDHSYSMRGPKMVLAALTAATIALHFRTDYGVVSFASDVQVLKRVREGVPAPLVLDRVFDLPVRGLTNVAEALAAGLNELSGFSKPFGLLLTDGGWTAGQDPLAVAARFTRLNVIAFPPANPKKIRLLAEAGHGTFHYVEDEEAITRAITRAVQVR